jgi:hypothetical protein
LDRDTSHDHARQGERDCAGNCRTIFRHSRTHTGGRNRKVADIESALLAIEATTETDWQTIETAAKDGTKILALLHYPALPDAEPFQDIVRFDKRYGFWVDKNNHVVEGKHQFAPEVKIARWQSLPTASAALIRNLKETGDGE